MRELVKFYKASYHRNFYVYEEINGNTQYYLVVCREFPNTNNSRQFEFLSDDVPTDRYLENYKEEEEKK